MRAIAHGLGLIALLSMPVWAAEITLVPTQDTPIFSDDGGVSTINFSSHSNGAGYTLFVGTNGTGSARRTLLQFDLSGLPAGAVVTKAELSLTADREPNASNQLLSVHVVTTGWTTGSSNSDIMGSSGQGAPAAPGDATWYDASWPSPSRPGGVLWTTPGGDFKSAVSASTWVGPLGVNGVPLTYVWSSQGLADDVNAWIQRPSTNHGWIITGNESQTQSVKRFISREALDSSGQTMSTALLPHLVLTYEIGGSPTSGGSDSGASSSTYASTPWGKLRRRVGQPRPAPCCW